jgi:hypothetical protein
MKIRSRFPEKYSEAVANEARRLFSYSKKTGRLTRRVNQANQKAGSNAGCYRTITSGVQYMVVRICSDLYPVHRVAWLLHYGSWPSGIIDHRDGDGTNNRIFNLRIVTHTENLKNCHMWKHNTSGSTGVTWDKLRNKWMAKIKVNQKTVNLGRFQKYSDAVKARKEAEKKHGFSERHGSTRNRNKGKK